MNFLEALEANKTHGLRCIDTNVLWSKNAMEEVPRWYVESIKSQWQIVEPTVTITKSELEKAWRKIYGMPVESRVTLAFTELCKELGLG